MLELPVIMEKLTVSSAEQQARANAARGESHALYIRFLGFHNYGVRA